MRVRWNEAERERKRLGIDRVKGRERVRETCVSERLQRETRAD